MLNLSKIEQKETPRRDIDVLKLQQELCQLEFNSLNNLIKAIRSSYFLYQAYAQSYPIHSNTVFAAFPSIESVTVELDMINLSDDFKALDENTFKNFMTAYKKLRGSINNFKWALSNGLLIEFEGISNTFSSLKKDTQSLELEHLSEDELKPYLRRFEQLRISVEKFEIDMAEHLKSMLSQLSKDISNENAPMIFKGIEATIKRLQEQKTMVSKATKSGAPEQTIKDYQYRLGKLHDEFFTSFKEVLALDNLWKYVPVEIQTHIAGYLDGKSLARLNCVDRRTRQITNNDKIWENCCRAEGLKVVKPAQTTYRSFYLEKLLYSQPNFVLFLRVMQLQREFNGLKHADEIRYNHDVSSLNYKIIGAGEETRSEITPVNTVAGLGSGVGDFNFFALNVEEFANKIRMRYKIRAYDANKNEIEKFPGVKPIFYDLVITNFNNRALKNEKIELENKIKKLRADLSRSHIIHSKSDKFSPS